MIVSKILNKDHQKHNCIPPTHTPTHPQPLSMKEVSNNKTQRVKVTQYDHLYLLSTKKQVDSKRENRDESNMFKANILSKKSVKSLRMSGPIDY